jgi:hypothetical protein
MALSVDDAFAKLLASLDDLIELAGSPHLRAGENPARFDEMVAIIRLRANKLQAVAKGNQGRPPGLTGG